MENKIKERYGSYIHLLTLLLFVICAFYMYDFYKSLSGFIANGFREAFVMAPIFLSYFLPVLCFFFYFYDFYIGKMARAVKIGYSVLIIAYSLVNLFGLFNSIDIYSSNSDYGAYDALLGVIIKFPYDAIIFNILLLGMQALNIFMLIKPEHSASLIKSELQFKGYIKLGIVEYILICILCVLVFVFVGASVSATKNAIENAFYDAKFAFLLAWVFLVPLVNLLYLVFKPEKRLEAKRDKIIFLSAGIFANALFFAFVLIFEKVSPDYMVHLSKPIFTIAFSVSLPIEMLVLIGIMAICSLIFLVRLILIIIKKSESEPSKFIE